MNQKHKKNLYSQAQEITRHNFSEEVESPTTPTGSPYLGSYIEWLLSQIDQQKCVLDFLLNNDFKRHMCKFKIRIFNLPSVSHVKLSG